MSGQSEYTCETCGQPFAHEATSAGGRPPKHCPEHRKKSGPKEGRDHAGNAARRQADNQRRALNKTPDMAGQGDLALASKLAAGAPSFDNPQDASAWLGLHIEQDRLERLWSLAHKAFPDVAIGKPEGTGRVLLSAIQVIAQDIIDHRAAISPRDLPHVLRALAQTHDILVGERNAATYAVLEMSLQGPEGEKITLGLPTPETPEAVH